MMVPLEGYDQILSLHATLKQLESNHWIHFETLTFQWWTMNTLFLIAWATWWRFFDRSRTAYIVIYGFFVLFTATAMDALGIHYHLWMYPIKPTATIPHLTPINWGILPVTYMLIYQYYTNWNSFIRATTVMSVLFSFVGEPFTEWFGIYYPFHWEHIWSLPIYIMIAVVAKWLTEYLLGMKPRT